MPLEKTAGCASSLTGEVNLTPIPYNPNTYAARIWIEHFRSVLPDSPFRAYGDVLAAKTEAVEINGVKKLALFVQIEPTDDLISRNKARQKLYTSIEINPKFADTGRAYLDGLAVTDAPASLGTEMLAFSAKNPDASLRRYRKAAPQECGTCRRFAGRASPDYGRDVQC